jgi:hypothetical protein
MLCVVDTMVGDAHPTFNNENFLQNSEQASTFQILDVSRCRALIIDIK